jgi:hypothetical protein
MGGEGDLPMRARRSGVGLGSLLVAVLIVLALGVGTVYAAIPNGNGFDPLTPGRNRR